MTQFTALLLTFLFSASAFSSAKPPKLELELNSYQYQALLASRFQDEEKHVLTPVMEAGKRSLEWLKFINDHRPANQKISLSTADTQKAYPIDQPRISNAELTLAEFNTIKAELPAWYKAILFENAPFTENPPVSDAEYIKHGLRIDFNYQRAARWILQEPNLTYYALIKVDDIRGYYFFAKDPSHKEKLSSWGKLSSTQQDQYTEWLSGMCLNTVQVISSCEDEIAQDIKTKGHPLATYEKYFPKSKKLWDNYFTLNVKRPDVTWDAKQNIMYAAFLEPSIKEIKNFLTDNIEEEWKWMNWNLRLDYKVSGDFPRVVFKPGTTPNVNGLGGNIITMDQNAPLTEYDVQWTIRHEYGHVLGFDDCYIEFYDSSKKQMISYQLDITNLMCSRRGHLQEKHYSELKRVYQP